MILLIDAGNTRIKFGWLQVPGPLADAAERREPEPLALAHADLEAQLPQWLARLPAPPRKAIGVNVAGNGMAARIQALLEPWTCRIDWVRGTPAAAGVINGYRDPSQLGADRWLALIGLAAHARHLAESPLLLASFGTATTIDSLGPVQTCSDSRAEAGARRFHGGLILPGVRLMHASLASGTANLPMAQGTVAHHPDHTEQAIASGIAAAQAGALLRQWHIVRETCAAPPQIFVSGGAWFEIREEVDRLFSQACADQGHTASAIRWLPSLVLDGLARLAQGSDAS